MPEEYAADIKWLFQSYTDVIAYSFDDLRPSRFEVAYNFEWITEEPISERLRRLLSAYNEIVRREMDRMLEVGITS